jgi:hypothetical protein
MVEQGEWRGEVPEDDGGRSWRPGAGIGPLSARKIPGSDLCLTWPPVLSGLGWLEWGCGLGTAVVGRGGAGKGTEMGGSGEREPPWWLGCVAPERWWKVLS